MKEVVLTSDEAILLREIQLDILNQVVNICQKNDIQFFLIGGTCLGAVRHKGFIPWDDDIDIGMVRDDYEKFARLAQSELPDYMFYQDYKTDNEYPYLFAKIRNSNTLFLQGVIKKLDINHGVYIDIFPIDGAPTKKGKIKRHFRKIIFYNYIHQSASLNFNKGNIVKKSLIIMLRIMRIFIGKKRCARKVEKTLSKFKVDSCENIGNLIGTAKYKELFNKNVFYNGLEKKQMLFEGQLYNVPCDTDTYLRGLYGDYMKLPSVEKRVSHHNVIEINFKSNNSIKINN